MKVLAFLGCLTICIIITIFMLPIILLGAGIYIGEIIFWEERALFKHDREKSWLDY